jgi:hypothetical protein
MLAALVSCRVFTPQLLNRELHLPNEYVQYITKTSDQAPYLESLLVRHDIVGASSNKYFGALFVKMQADARHSVTRHERSQFNTSTEPSRNVLQLTRRCSADDSEKSRQSRLGHNVPS